MYTIGILLFPAVEELDFVAPFEVLSYVNKIQPASTNVLLIAEMHAPIRAFNGMRVIPDVTLAECPVLDILIVPGGKGRSEIMNNPAIMNFIQQQTTTAKYIASVCTGALILAAAGLLADKNATTYHTAFEELSAYGAHVSSKKVVQDGAIITAAGVSSGLELGFYLLNKLFGLSLAQAVATKIEYNLDTGIL